MKVAEIGMPLVLRPKTFPMEMFHPKCQPKANAKLPPVKKTLSPPATPPTKMLTMLCHRLPPGDCRCIATKKSDSTASADRKALACERPRCAPKASARLKSIHPRTGNSSAIATLTWKATSQNMFAAKFSDLSNTSKSSRICSQPAISSTAKMKATMETPTQVPTRTWPRKRPSTSSPSEAIERMSIHRQAHHTASTEPSAMPKRMHASLQRRRPLTWFSQKGCPGLPAKGRRRSPRSSWRGHAIEGSFTASSSFVGSQLAPGSPTSCRPTCRNTMAKSSEAMDCEKRKKNKRATMCILPSVEEWKTPEADAT
mmetsp:Transcript_15325/g.39502  ORF Transcript_15325/g.39502 Transcript_15325/m.39502 type:complete len:313 (+) Transcript_15325:107-1045(+)